MIERDGKILVTRRLPGRDLAGLWEFPGGKRHPGESSEGALRRELAEELGTRAVVGAAIDTIQWDYGDKRVRLEFFACTLLDEPRPLEGQEMKWLARHELAQHDFPAADAALISRLALG